jgi:bacillithiol system protein YtxJ
MNWIKLQNIADLETIRKESEQKTVLIFKHSTRCSISSTALSRLERAWTNESESIQPHYLDLLSHRDISNQIASTFSVAHESPQVLLIKNGNCIYNAAHWDISLQDIAKAATSI